MKPNHNVRPPKNPGRNPGPIQSGSVVFQLMELVARRAAKSVSSETEPVQPAFPRKSAKAKRRPPATRTDRRSISKSARRSTM
jgi:hypothetical protein